MKTVDAGSTGTFVYNAVGQRVQKNIGGTSYYYLHDAFGNVSVVRSASSLLEKIIPGANAKYYQNGAGWKTDYLHGNPLGTTQIVTQADTSVEEERIFYPFGILRWQSGGSQDVRFAGMQERDSETVSWQNSLDWTPNRTFGENMGRWFSPDPMGGDVTSPQSLNRYAYALNSPTNFVDPMGLCPGCSDSPFGHDPGGPECMDPTYADAHAECQQPGSPTCFAFSFLPQCSGGPIFGGEGSGGGGSGGGSSDGAGAASSPGNGVSDYFNSSGGCIQPSFLQRLTFFGLKYVAKILPGSGNARSIGIGSGASGAIGSPIGLGPTGSYSNLDVVDANGNAANVTTIQLSVNPAIGVGGVAGAQAQISKSAVPTTPRFSKVWESDPTVSLGAGALLGANADWSWSGAKTVTAGLGDGAKASLGGSLLPALVISGAIPYCHSGGIYWQP